MIYSMYSMYNVYDLSHDGIGHSQNINKTEEIYTNVYEWEIEVVIVKYNMIYIYIYI